MLKKLGKLRHYVDIERKGQATGSRGQNNAAFATLNENVAATVQDLTGRELEIARQVVATASTKIVMRWHEVTEADRIVWGSRVFNVGYINRLDNRKLYLELLCTEER